MISTLNIISYNTMSYRKFIRRAYCSKKIEENIEVRYSLKELFKGVNESIKELRKSIEDTRKAVSELREKVSEVHIFTAIIATGMVGVAIKEYLFNPASDQKKDNQK